MFWIAWYEFARRIGVRYPEESARRLAMWDRIARSANWWWALEGWIVASERPEHVAFDDRRRLHSEVGMAVRYRDGWGVWAVHGVRIDPERGERVVLHPESLTVEEINREGNIEVRRVMLARFGEERYLRETNAELVAQDEFGKLWRAPRPDDSPLVMLEVACPSTDRTYFLRVPPGVERAEQAWRWTLDVPAEADVVAQS